MDSAIHSVRSLFPQVFANGFTPIPNFDKRCFLKGWPTIRVDERQVALWSRTKRWKAMGLRMKPPLLVVDIDVLDARLVAEIEALLPKGTLRRIGKAPKTAHFLRFEGEAFHRIRTRRWAADTTIEKPQWSAVEIFAGGGGGHQFGAFGPHKIDDDTKEVLSTYQWPDGRDPSNTCLSDLPTIDAAAVWRLANAAEALFKTHGFTLDTFTRGGAHQVDQVFDLDGQVFEGDGVAYDLSSLEAEARVAMVKGGQVRVTGSFTGDPFSVGSLRCRAGISHFNRVYIHDFKTGLTHHPSDAAALAGDGAEPDDFTDILKLIEEPK